MQRYASMRDAYDSIYTKAPDTSIAEALTLLQQKGIITEDEHKSLMERQETDLEKMTRQLKVSNARKKPVETSADRAQKAKNYAGNSNAPGMMDHSKKND